MCKKLSTKQASYILHLENISSRENVAQKLGVSISTYARWKSSGEFPESAILLIDQYIRNDELRELLHKEEIKYLQLKQTLTQWFHIQKKLAEDIFESD